MAERKQLTKEQQEALQATGALASFAVATPAGTILPFQNLIQDTSKIKKQEAMRMFPQADPNMFDYTRGGALAGKTIVPTIPLSQGIASSRVFNQNVLSGDLTSGSPLYPNNLYKGQKDFPTYLSSKPGAPSPELGSYAQAIGNKAIFPEGDIQAITVTPAPNPSRFAKDYAEVLADKLGKTLNEKEQFLNQQLNNWEENYAKGINIENTIENNTQTLNTLNKKVNILSDKVPGTAGYVWGNINKPQYSYAEGNWGLGQKEAGSNPSIYLSRINADPSKEANYLFTANILPKGEGAPDVDPRVKFTQYQDLGPATGPSWGVAPNEDISFRKDLIGARGELTVGDLQALLAERNLPFAYQSYWKTADRTVTNKSGINAVIKGESQPTQPPGNILKENLQKLADAEGISTSQAIEKFARLVPNVGEPVTPPTPAVIGKQGEFPIQGQIVSPVGGFAAKTDLRQIGILPPTDRAKYSPFTFDDFNLGSKHIYPRYNASSLKEISPSRVVPALPGSMFEEDFIPGTYQLNINRDALRPQAANKLLDRTVGNLIKQAEPIKGLGLGGFATGALATAMDPAVINALSSEDYTQAGTTAALNSSIGSLVGGATAKGLQALQAAGYARSAAVIGESLPLAGGVLAGLGLIETGKALNQAYRARTGKNWTTRNQTQQPIIPQSSVIPSIQPRMGTAILGGKPTQVPYGSVAGTKTVGRPWWDQLGSKAEAFANLLNRGSVIGR